MKDGGLRRNKLMDGPNQQERQGEVERLGHGHSKVKKELKLKEIGTAARTRAVQRATRSVQQVMQGGAGLCSMYQTDAKARNGVEVWANRV